MEAKQRTADETNHMPRHLSKERAQEIRRLASEWPFWGNYTRFMSNEERYSIRQLWLEASKINGELSIASVLDRIAAGRDPITGKLIEA